MSRLLLALVFGATTATATGCYGSTGYVGVDSDGYYDGYPYYYGAYTTYPYDSGRYYSPYYGPYYGSYRYPYYRSAPYYSSSYYRGAPYYHSHRAAPVYRDHRSTTHHAPGYHVRSAPGHYGPTHHSGYRKAPGGTTVHRSGGGRR